MGKTVRFKFGSSSTSTPGVNTTTTTSISSLSSASHYSSTSPPSSLLTNCFMSINNNIKMLNGNDRKDSNANRNYSRLSSSSSSSSLSRNAIPVAIAATTISTSHNSPLTSTATATTDDYNAIYPSAAVENQPTTSYQQLRGIRSIGADDDDIIHVGIGSDVSGARAGVNGASAIDGIASCNGDNDDNDGHEGEERSSSRNNLLASGNNIDYDSMTEVFDDLAETEPTSAILDFCKRTFLRFYLNLLGLAGIYPTSSDTSCLGLCLSYLQSVIILTILCFGYYLQYRSSFRRDRGFSVNSSVLLTASLEMSPYYREALDFGDILFIHIIPSTLHLLGFLSAAYVFRIADNEQLQNLVERVFLLTNRPKRLCVILWLHVVAGFIWLAMFTAYMVFLVYAQPEDLQLGMFVVPGMSTHSASRIALIAATFTQDAIQMTVLTAYCIECYLLRLHLRNLKEKLMQHTIETIDWMREVLEFRKLLNHLNRKVATPVCFFTVMNLSYGFAGLVYIFKEYDFNCPIKIFLLNFGNIILWLIIGMIPFFQAATVTRGCQSTQYSGHQIRVRPFVYHNTASSELDSTLLFASSLQMSAKLFRMPIQSNYLYFSILIISIVVLTLGMCLNISLGLLNN